MYNKLTAHILFYCFTLTTWMTMIVKMNTGLNEITKQVQYLKKGKVKRYLPYGGWTC